MSSVLSQVAREDRGRGASTLIHSGRAVKALTVVPGTGRISSCRLVPGAHSRS